ncbi:MAG: N-acetylmuramoyl-L-alanine amidase [candidate division WOR-3 bacterium]|jgi:N-acetylmuramoyl-L-alanine amidase|nr:N-acetylmuramoyl-L-alanine amidase [candidate division WOR-3 bacterium]MCR4424163.1 N-acetylmuramoyl-L-alanine amidase [candidate division WOR-3 bacterium]MDH7519418.1 N-acetylmuramoyl-L-alanine amidase [bacterium]
MKRFWFHLLALLIFIAGIAGTSGTTSLRQINGIDYLPLSGVVAKYGGKCYWVENRFIALLPGSDSSFNEYLFIPDSSVVLHNGRRLKLPIAPLVDKGQLYLPAVLIAGMLPELDVPVLSTVETDKKADTLIVRLLLNPVQKKSGNLLFIRDRKSSLELRLTLGCRTDSGFASNLRLISLTSGSMLNGVHLDTLSVGANLFWNFRQPTQDTILLGPNGIELRLWPKPQRRVNKIILDPGHGGKDPGAIGRLGTEEKTIVLDIARRVKKHLTQQGFEVILTRDSDDYVSLAERAEKAAKSGADLFVSIHANAAPNRSATGLETYFLSEAKTDWERAVAARENAAFERELANPLIKDNDPVTLILADLAQNEFLFESSELASRIQEAALSAICAQDRGVRQANFYVLRNIFMPAVLVECGFLSNRQEEKLLRNPAHREKIARAIAQGIKNFTRDYESRLNGTSKKR